MRCDLFRRGFGPFGESERRSGRRIRRCCRHLRRHHLRHSLRRHLFRRGFGPFSESERRSERRSGCSSSAGLRQEPVDGRRTPRGSSSAGLRQEPVDGRRTPRGSSNVGLRQKAVDGRRPSSRCNRPGAHDDLELVDVDLTVLVRVRTRHHFGDGLIGKAPLVFAQDVSLHLIMVDLTTLVFVHLGKRRLQARIRLVDACAKKCLKLGSGILAALCGLYLGGRRRCSSAGLR